MFARVAAGVVSTSLLALLAGCGLGSAPSAVGSANIQIGGAVHGGQAPVTSSNIALFITTPAGTANAAYGVSLTPVATTTSNSVTGNWTISTTYSCPTGSFAYIVATGGNPGGPANTDNSAIFMVAALGACGTFGSNTFVDINEVTTVAAAYTLGAFGPTGAAGMTEASIIGKGSVPGFTTSTANAQGLSDAFANAANLANISTGQPNSLTTGGNGVVPAATLDALADILQDCVNSTGPTGSSVYGGTSCSSLFSAATTPGGLVPVNVFQAAVDIANYPANNATALYNLISSKSAFPQTTITSAPNDWSVGISYTSAQLNTPLGMVIDKNDNVYVTGSTSASLMEFNGQGVLLSPAGGFTPSLVSATDNVRNAAFDPAGSLWLSDGNASGTVGLYEYLPAGTATAPTQGTLTPQAYTAASNDYNNYIVVSDNSGNIFTPTYKSSTCSGTTTTSTAACMIVEEAVGAPTPYTAYSTFSTVQLASPGTGGARAMAYDTKTNNIWFGDIDESDVVLTTLTPNATGVASIKTAPQTIAIGTTAASPTKNQYGVYGIAIDGSSNAWVVQQGGPVSSTQTTAIPAGLFEVSSTGTVTAICAQTQNVTPCGSLLPATASYDIVDGNGNIFVANGGSIVQFNPALNGTTVNSATVSGFVSGSYGFTPGTTGTPGNSTNDSIYKAKQLVADRSGALWTLSTGSTVTPGSTTTPANLVQIFGVAAPTNPVLATAAYGTKP